jgi:hypothetical protein
VTLPLVYVRPEENVVDATQLGTPFSRARTLPAVPADVVEIALVPLPYISEPDCMFDHPVPPFRTLRRPPKVRVPELVIGPPENDRPVEPPEALTDVTVPKPREEVAYGVNPPCALPSKRDDEAIDVSPVPPYTTPTDVVAETTPLLA